MKNILHKIERLFGVYRWHPKIALRYLPIVREIRQAKLTNPTVLEIGSGSLGIAPYLKKKVTGLDLYFPSPHFPLLYEVTGSGTDIPFSDKSFDFILSVDMLEHIARTARKKAIEEAVRVCKRELIIAVPCGRYAIEHDKRLAHRYKQKFGKDFTFLKEHIQYGLPTQSEIKALITSAATKYDRQFILQTRGLLNISVRDFLMQGWMTKSKMFDFLFRKVFLLGIPILRLCNFEPTYRKMFFVQFKNNQT